MSDPVELIVKRDEKGLEYLKAEYGRECYGLLVSLLRDREEAEEALDDVWLRLWEAIPREQPRNLRAYLLTVCRNVARDHIKYRQAAKRKGVQVLLDELAEILPDGSAIQQEETVFLRDCLNRFLHALPQEDRSLFLRRYWYGRSGEELARELGKSRSSVESRLCRTREKLRKFLEKEGYAL